MAKKESPGALLRLIQPVLGVQSPGMDLGEEDDTLRVIRIPSSLRVLAARIDGAVAVRDDLEIREALRLASQAASLGSNQANSRPVDGVLTGEVLSSTKEHAPDSRRGHVRVAS